MDKVGPSSGAPVRLWSLDALRGVCAGVVFLSHWYLWSDFAPANPVERLIHQIGGALHEGVALLTWPTGGHHPAVIGFFVLSGFCIHYPFERRALAGEPPPRWRDYFRRRFLRIMPVYWTACLLGLIFVAAQTLRPSGSLLLALHATCSVESVVVRLTGLAGIYPREIFAGNYILTTVTVEIFIYAAYPLIYRFAAHGKWRLLGIAFLGLHFIAIGLLAFFSPYWVFNSIFMLGIFWYAGAFAAHLYLTGRARTSGRWLLLTWGLFLALKMVPHFLGLNLFKQAAWGLVCTLGILWTLHYERDSQVFGNSRWARALCRIGDISYSLYAMHTPAIMLATWTLLQLGLQNYLVQLAATFVASIATVLAVHVGIERAFYRPRVPTVPPQKADYSNHPSASSVAM